MGLFVCFFWERLPATTRYKSSPGFAFLFLLQPQLKQPNSGAASQQPEVILSALQRMARGHSPAQPGAGRIPLCCHGVGRSPVMGRARNGLLFGVPHPPLLSPRDPSPLGLQRSGTGSWRIACVLWLFRVKFSLNSHFTGLPAFSLGASVFCL